MTLSKFVIQTRPPFWPGLLLAMSSLVVMAQPASESRFVTIDAFSNKTPEQALAEALQSPEGRPAEEDPEGHWSPVLEGFQLSLRFSKQEYVIGEPVTAILLKRNTLYEPVEWRGSSSAAEGFSFLIVNEQLRAVPSLSEPIIGGSSRSQRLEARTQRRFILDLAKEYDLSRPGTYSVSASHHVFSREKGVSVPQQSGTALIRLVSPATNLVRSATTNAMPAPPRSAPPTSDSARISSVSPKSRSHGSASEPDWSATNTTASSMADANASLSKGNVQTGFAVSRGSYGWLAGAALGLAGVLAGAFLLQRHKRKASAPPPRAAPAPPPPSGSWR